MRPIIFLESNLTGADMIVECLQLGIEVYLFSSKMEILGQVFCHLDDDRIHKISLSEKLTANLVLQKIFELKLNPELILSFDDNYIEVAAQVSELFGTGTLSLKTVQICKNKFNTRKCLPAILNLESRLVESPRDLPCASTINLPIILKPQQGTASLGVQKIQTIDEYNELLVQNDDFPEAMVIETFFEGKLYSAEFFSFSKDDHLLLGYFDREIDENFAELDADFLPPNHFPKQVAENLREALHSVNFDRGPSHIEFIMNDKGDFKLIEINARAAGGAVYRALDRIYNNEIYKMMLSSFRQERIESKKTLNHAMATLHICAPKKGILKAIPAIESLKQKFNIDSGIYFKNIGDSVTPVKSNFDWLGILVLKGAQLSDLKNEKNKIREYVGNEIIIL